MDWTDKRLLDTIPFGYEHPEAERVAAVERVRTLLVANGVKVADDIVKLGCTTLFGRGVAIEDIKFLRLGLAGSGCGMPCFVPPDRYCLAHETIGGLQDGQDALDDAQIPAISRALTPEESVRTSLVEKARRLKGRDGERISKASDMLSGRDLPEGLLAEAGEPEIDPSTEGDPNILGKLPWICDEHAVPNWNCRYCVASGIVHGDEFEPVFLTLISTADEEDTEEEEVEKVSGAEIDEHIDNLNKSNVRSVELYVRAARWSRRLTRE